MRLASEPVTRPRSAREAAAKQGGAVGKARPRYIAQPSLGHPRAILTFGVGFAVAIEVQEGEIEKDTFGRAQAVVVDDAPPGNCDLAAGVEATRRVQDRTARLF